MVCDNCHERDAVVNLTTIENNAVRQLHLCEKCAAERGVETTVAAPKHPLGEFLQAVQQQSVPASAEAGKCSFCGLTMKDFRETGRMGCARCYTTFRVEHARAAAPGARRPAAHRARRIGAAEGRVLDRARSLGELARSCAAPSSRSSSKPRRSCATASGCWNDARSLSAPGRRRELARRIGRARRHRAVHARAARAERGGLRVCRTGARWRAAARAGAGARGAAADSGDAGKLPRARRRAGARGPAAAARASPGEQGAGGPGGATSVAQRGGRVPLRRLERHDQRGGSSSPAGAALGVRASRRVRGARPS